MRLMRSCADGLSRLIESNIHSLVYTLIDKREVWCHQTNSHMAQHWIDCSWVGYQFRDVSVDNSHFSHSRCHQCRSTGVTQTWARSIECICIDCEEHVQNENIRTSLEWFTHHSFMSLLMTVVGSLINLHIRLAFSMIYDSSLMIIL
jgi:hypothetical protein